MGMITGHFFTGLAALLALAGCGFSPMYGGSVGGGDQQVTSNLAQIEIGIVPDDVGQMLRNDLIDRFYTNGYPVHPAYHLTIEPLKESRTDLDITKSSEATRSQLRLTSKMILRDGNGKDVLTRDLFSLTSFNVLKSEFATRVTEQNARDSAVHDLARQVERNLALYFGQDVPAK